MKARSDECDRPATIPQSGTNRYLVRLLDRHIRTHAPPAWRYWEAALPRAVRDDLQLRAFAASKGRGNPYEKGVLHLIEQQTPAGDWKPIANAPAAAHLTGPALIFLAGETAYTAAPKAQNPK